MEIQEDLSPEYGTAWNKNSTVMTLTIDFSQITLEAEYTY